MWSIHRSKKLFSRASILVLTAIITFVFLTSCSSDDDPTNPVETQTPIIENILPLGAGTGVTITIHGKHFGYGSKRANSVMFGDVPATSYSSWSDERIKVVVPTFSSQFPTALNISVVVDGKQSNTFTIYLQDDNVTRLTRNSFDDWQPCWANNSIIYYASAATGNFNIWYINDTGGTPTQRTSFTEGQTDMPAVSSSNLYYRSNHNGDWDIYVSSGTGSEGPITSTPEKDFEVVAAPAYGPYTIALSRAEEHNGGTIWNIYGKGNSALVQISDNRADFHPTFSPNGMRVAYMYKFGDWDPGQIMVVSALGGDSTLISDPEHSCAYPTWNWAYDTIAYTRSINGRRNIFMCNPDGTDEVQLTFSAFDIVYPAWSPDGKRLAYASFIEGNRELFVIDVSGILESQ